MRIRYLTGFWLVLIGSLLIVGLLFAFAPTVKRAYRTVLADQATAQAVAKSAAANLASAAKRAAGQPQGTPPVTPSPANIPTTGSTAVSPLPTLVYLLLIAAVLLLTSELLVLTRPKKPRNK